MKRIIFSLGLVLLFSACKKMFIAEPELHPVAIFENFWQTMDEEYAPFEERNINWDSIYNHFRPMVTEETTDDELFHILSQMIAPFDDGHLSLTAPNRPVYFSNRFYRDRIDDELFSRDVVATYLAEGAVSGPDKSYLYGKIKVSNVAYMHFDHVGTNFLDFNDFLDQYKSASGLIVDLRHNHGGDFTFALSEMGRLTNEKRYVFRSRTKNGKSRYAFTEWANWYLEPRAPYVNKPIIVLIDRYTISAAERALMAFKSLPNVRLMGDTTNGAQGSMIGRVLANGWYFSVVPQKVEMFDGHSYEGLGIAPDIVFKYDLEDMRSGKDEMLEAAVAILE